MNVSDGLEFFALADRLKFSGHKGKACSANKCRIRESDLQAACLYITFLNGY